jgi:signal transduction histidine kinase
MLYRDYPFRDTLQDLRAEMVGRLTLVAVVFYASMMYLLLLNVPLRVDIFGVLGVAAVAVIAIRRRARRHLDLARYVLLALLHVTFIAALYIMREPWLPYMGLPLVFIGGMIVTHGHMMSAVVIFGISTLLDSSAAEVLAVTLLLTVAVTHTAVSTFYTALMWYSSMQKRADDLLEEARTRRAELAETLKSLEIAYQSQHRVRQQLNHARKQAHEARLMKERFAANISHELRTPLNLILGFTEIMYMTPEVYGDIQFTPKLALPQVWCRLGRMEHP